MKNPNSGLIEGIGDVSGRQSRQGARGGSNAPGRAWGGQGRRNRCILLGWRALKATRSHKVRRKYSQSPLPPSTMVEVTKLASPRVPNRDERHRREMSAIAER